MPQFLKYCGFKDIKDMSFVFAVHTNRKHQPHIHFAFIEKNQITYIAIIKLIIEEKEKLVLMSKGT